MRIIIILLTFSTLCFAQTKKSTNLLASQAPCTFEMTIDELITDDLKFKCAEIFENKAFGIEDFKIKFRGHPTILVLGNSLNSKTQRLAKNLKIGDYVTIFQIENIIIDGENSQKFKTLNIKIVEP